METCTNRQIENLLPDFFFGELVDPERSEDLAIFTEHIKECSDCWTLILDLLEVDETFVHGVAQERGISPERAMVELAKELGGDLDTN